MSRLFSGKLSILGVEILFFFHLVKKTKIRIGHNVDVCPTLVLLTGQKVLMFLLMHLFVDMEKFMEESPMSDGVTG